MILIPIIAFAIMHVSNFANKIFAETSFRAGFVWDFFTKLHFKIS